MVSKGRDISNQVQDPGCDDVLVEDDLVADDLQLGARRWRDKMTDTKKVAEIAKELVAFGRVGGRNAKGKAKDHL